MLRASDLKRHQTIDLAASTPTVSALRFLLGGMCRSWRGRVQRPGNRDDARASGRPARLSPDRLPARSVQCGNANRQGSDHDRRRCPTALAAQKLRQQSAGVRFQRFRDLDEFDDIQPALATLVFGDEGLGTTQPFGNIYLGELPGFSGSGQQFLQSSLPWRAERFWHGDRLLDEAGSSNNPDFGLSHIRIFLSRGACCLTSWRPTVSGRSDHDRT